MEKFIKELRKELEKRYDGKDVDDIVDFYQEIITDRVDNGEDIDDVLGHYDIDDIVKMSGPSVYSSKKEYKVRDARKGAISLIRILFSSLFTVPLGIIYFVFLVVMVAMVISGFAVGLAGIMMIIYSVVALALHNATIGLTLGMIGLSLFGMMVAIGICMGLMKGCKIASKKILQLSSIRIRKKETVWAN